MREPQVVRTPCVQNRSLCAIGTPSSAPSPPRASSRSAARAAASASSACTLMKALSPAWLRSMRPRNSPTSSTLEKLRRRSPAASSAGPLPCRSLTGASLDHLRYQVQAALDLRGVALVLRVVIALADHILPQSLRQPGERVGQRLDASGLAGLERAHEVDDPRQALLVNRDLLGGELKTRQGGDACDLLAGEAHGRCARCV